MQLADAGSFGKLLEKGGALDEKNSQFYFAQVSPSCTMIMQRPVIKKRKSSMSLDGLWCNAYAPVQHCPPRHQTSQLSDGRTPEWQKDRAGVRLWPLSRGAQRREGWPGHVHHSVWHSSLHVSRLLLHAFVVD